MAASDRSSKATNKSTDRTVYSEFGNGGNAANPEALKRAVPDLPPNQQTLKVEASRKGRGGKTVTVISGFQVKPETLTTLAKQLKAQCGTGGTVKEATIEIQGDHKQTIVDFLIKQGYKAKASGGK
ncbi:MAG TPA: translation initiation factor [Thermosynechococcaceae cyanobacterium]